MPNDSMVIPMSQISGNNINFYILQRSKYIYIRLYRELKTLEFTRIDTVIIPVFTY
jgi:hypothetical protein